MFDGGVEIAKIVTGTTTAAEAAQGLADKFVSIYNTVSAIAEILVGTATVIANLVSFGAGKAANPFVTTPEQVNNLVQIKNTWDQLVAMDQRFKDLEASRNDLTSPGRNKFQQDIQGTKDAYAQKAAEVRKGEADLSITRAQGTKMLAEEAQKQKTILAQSLADYEKDIEARKVSAKVKDDLIGQAQKQFTRATGADDLAGPIEDVGNRPDLSKSGKQPKEDFNLELARIKTFYADAQNAVKEGETNLGITRSLAVALIESLGAREKAEIEKAVNTYRAALQTQTGDTKKRNEELTHLEAERLNLLRGVQGQTTRSVDSTNKKFDQDDIKQSKTNLETQLAQIKDYYEKQYDIVKDGEAALIVSKREGATLTASIATEEKILQNIAIDNFERYIQNTISDYKQRNEIIRTAELEREKLLAGVDKNVASAVKAGISEGAQVDLAQLRASLSLKKQALQEQFQYEQELAKLGKLTQTQLLDAKTAEEKKSFDEEIGLLDKQMQSINADTVEWERLYATKTALEQKYTADVQLRAAQRIKASNDELIKLREHTDALKTLQLERSTTESAIAHLGPTTPTVDLTPFSNKSAELDIAQKRLELELKYNEAHGVEAETNNKIIAQLQQISNQRLTILHDELTAIAGSNQPEVVKKQDQQNDLKGRIADEKLQELAAVLRGDADAVKRHADAVIALQKQLDNFNPSFADTLNTLQQNFFGFDLVGKLKDATGPLQTLGDVASATSKAIDVIGKVIGDVQSGLKKGGTLGGIGAGLSDVGGLIPGPVGAAVGAAGSILSLVGSLFTAAAQHIADEINKDFNRTLEKFSTGQATLVQTIQAVQYEEAQAIARLSGRKGGQAQLDQLLPQLNAQIDALKKQQIDLKTAFETSLDNLKLQSPTLAGIAQQWQAINKQVAEYIGAGGDWAKAQEFLALNLKAIQKDSQTQLNAANDQAIQDAINLNSLLLQRNKLQASFLDQQFAIANGDSIERRQGDISKARQELLLKTQHAIDIANLNAEINLTTQKVAAESKVFKISTDISTLHQQDAALQLSALNLQIQGWQDLKKVIQSISSGTGLGSLGFSTGLTPQQTTTIGVINNTINVTPPLGSDPKAVGKAIGDSLSDELQRRMRQGNR